MKHIADAIIEALSQPQFQQTSLTEEDVLRLIMETKVPKLNGDEPPTVEETIRVLMNRTLEYYGGHMERSAASMGVSLKTLYNWRRKYSIQECRESADESTKAKE